MKKSLCPQNWNSINSQLKKNQITIIDNFFTQELLSILKIRILYANHVDTNYKTYQAIDYRGNQDYITNLIVKELKNKLDILPLFQRAWSFVYNTDSPGVPLHADPSKFNINIWVSSNESVKDKLSNGLEIYKISPPSDWKRKDWNAPQSTGQIKQYIDAHNIQPTLIEYKSNRAVIFDGTYFHQTHFVSMKAGVENRRVSYTMLFGLGLNES